MTDLDLVQSHYGCWPRQTSKVSNDSGQVNRLHSSRNTMSSNAGEFNSKVIMICPAHSVCSTTTPYKAFLFCFQGFRLPVGSKHFFWLLSFQYCQCCLSFQYCNVTLSPVLQALVCPFQIYCPMNLLLQQHDSPYV